MRAASPSAQRRLTIAKAPRHVSTPPLPRVTTTPTSGPTVPYGQGAHCQLRKLLAAGALGECVPPGVKFTDLVNKDMQTTLACCEARRGETALQSLVRECCKDLASRNGYETFVTAANVPMHTSFAACADVRLGVVVHEVGAEQEHYARDMRAACDIFVRNKLLCDNNFKNNMHDMHTLTQPPYRCCVAKHGDQVVGGVVYSLHGTSDGRRMVYIELLASEMAEVGTLLFQHMRAVPGARYFLAWCVTTGAADALYRRQLPQVNTPVARSLVLSLVCKDPLYKLRPDLQLRCDVVH